MSSPEAHTSFSPPAFLSEPTLVGLVLVQLQPGLISQDLSIPPLAHPSGFRAPFVPLALQVPFPLPRVTVLLQEQEPTFSNVGCVVCAIAKPPLMG